MVVITSSSNGRPASAAAGNSFAGTLRQRRRLAT